MITHHAPPLDPQSPDFAGTLRRLDGRVSQDPLQIVQVPSVPQIINCKRMPTRMKRTPHASNAKVSTELLKITKQVPLRRLRTMQRAKDQRVLVLGKNLTLRVKGKGNKRRRLCCFQLSPTGSLFWSGRRDLNPGPLAPQLGQVNHLKAWLFENKRLGG